MRRQARLGGRGYHAGVRPPSHAHASLPGDRPRISRIGAPQEIVRLAHGWLGRGNGVYYRPSVPPLKEAAARSAHAAYLRASEPVLVLHDATLLGSGENGFLVTPERLCWKNFFEHPRQIAWSEIDPASVVANTGSVNLAGGNIVVSGEIAAPAAQFFAELAACSRHDPEGPYRRRAEATADTAEGQAAAVARLAARVRPYLGEVEDLFYHPAIPASKLERARAMHAVHLPRGEAAAVLYDDTLFGSAEEGFLLTPHRICWKILSSGPLALAWDQIEVDRISASTNVVHVMGGALHFTSQSELAAPVAALLAALVEEARKGLL